MAINFQRLTKIQKTVTFEKNCEIMRGHYVTYKPTLLDLWSIWRKGLKITVHALTGREFYIEPCNPDNQIRFVERTKCS